jgi:hypothetical protein
MQPSSFTPLHVTLNSTYEEYCTVYANSLYACTYSSHITGLHLAKFLQLIIFLKIYKKKMWHIGKASAYKSQVGRFDPCL